MSRINFYSSQRLTADQVNKISTNYINDIDNILSTIINDGIVTNYPDVTAEFNLTITDATHFNVEIGRAVIQGRYVSIESNEAYTSTYKDVKPYMSSGNQNIPVYTGVNGTLAVFIRPLYIQDPLFINYDISGNLVYTQDLDGYEIFTNPPDIITDDSIYIGKITISGGAITSISNDIDNRIYRKIPFDKLYIDASALDVEPQFAELIGKLFNNGIVSDRENVLLMQISYDFTQLETPLSRMLQTNEALLINGHRISANLDYAIGILDDAGSPRANGTYNIYYGLDGKLKAFLTSDDTFDVTQYLIIAQAVLTNGVWSNPDNPALLFPKDMRPLGIVDSTKIQDKVLRYMDVTPLGLNIINYQNNALGITVTFYDPNDAINNFVIEAYNSTTGEWEQITTIDNIK